MPSGTEKWDELSIKNHTSYPSCNGSGGRCNRLVEGGLLDCAGGVSLGVERALLGSADFEAQERSMKHSCPPYCHECPDVGGLYPQCMGGAVYSDFWRQRCTCQRGTGEQTQLAQILERLDRIEKRIGTLNVPANKRDAARQGREFSSHSPNSSDLRTL